MLSLWDEKMFFELLRFNGACRLFGVFCRGQSWEY